MDYTDKFNERENILYFIFKTFSEKYQQQNKEHFQQQAITPFYSEDMPPCAQVDKCHHLFL